MLPLADVQIEPVVFVSTIWSIQSFPELMGPEKLSEVYLKIFLSSLDFLNFISIVKRGIKKAFSDAAHFFRSSFSS